MLIMLIINAKVSDTDTQHYMTRQYRITRTLSPLSTVFCKIVQKAQYRLQFFFKIDVYIKTNEFQHLHKYVIASLHCAPSLILINLSTQVA